MAQAMMYRYVAYGLTLLGFYVSLVLFIRAFVDKLWKCMALSVFLIVLINPHGFFTLVPHYSW